MAFNRSGRWNRRTKRAATIQGPDPVYVTLKGVVPMAVEGSKDATPDSLSWGTYKAWAGQPVELYHGVIKGYGSQAPYSQDHIPCRLKGATAYSVVNLDEFNEA